MNVTTIEAGAAESRAVGVANAMDALATLPLALNSTLELKAVLRLLIEASLAASHADRCSIFMLRDGQWLEPSIAIGSRPDEDLWEQFRALPPIEVPLDVHVHRDLLSGRAVAISDARRSRVIPPPLVDTFDLRSVVLVPLLAAGEFCGLLVVDYQQRHENISAELTALELIASYAGLAVRNARLYGEERRRARLHECLSQGAAALASGDDTTGVCVTLTAAYRTMLEAQSCSIAVLDDTDSQVTVFGGSDLADDFPLDEVPLAVRDELRARWSVRLEPIRLEAAAWLSRLGGIDDVHATHVLVPLTVSGKLRGAVYLGFARKPRLDDDEEAAVTGLAAIASAALERALLLTALREQVARLDTLYRLDEVIGLACKPSRLRQRLNSLLKDTGYRVETIELSDRRIARRLEWPADEAAPATGAAARDCVRIPLKNGSRTLGALHVVPPSAAADGFLGAVAAGVAESLSRGAVQVALQESSRDKALAAERERIALDLHDTVGQSFVASMLLARRAAEELPADSEWIRRFERIVHVNREGKWALDQAVRALAFVPAAKAGLPTALRAFARSVGHDSGIHVVFHVNGRIRRLVVPVERALYRIGHQAISNAWRHARASAISVTLDYTDDAVTLSVRDNGIGLQLRPDGVLRGIGFASMRRAASEVGGRFSVANVAPTGLVVEACVPRRPA